MRAARAIALAAALTGASCGAPLVRLPSVSGAPAPDASAILAQATAACSRITSFSAEVAVSGAVAGRRLRGRILAGLARPDVAYLEAPAPFGAPLFIFAAASGQGMLLLPRDRRVLDGADPRTVLEAVTGVPLAPADLRTTLTGCAPEGGPAPDEARAPAPGWRVVSNGYDLYLRQERVTDPWRLVAVVREGASGWRADYRDFVDNLPRRIRLTSVGDRGVDLRLELSQIEPDASLSAADLRPGIPPGTQPITIDELRANGPLAR